MRTWAEWACQYGDNGPVGPYPEEMAREHYTFAKGRNWADGTPCNPKLMKRTVTVSDWEVVDS